MNIQQRGAFRLGRRQGPGDRQRLVGRKRHIDKTDRRPRGVDLPAVIRHIDEPASSQRGHSPNARVPSAVASRCAGMPSAALKRLRAPSTISAGKALAGSALRHAAVGALAGEHIPDRLRRRRLLRIETEHLGDAAGGGMLFAPGDCARRRGVVAFNKFAIPAWVNGRPGSAMPRRAASAGERSGRSSATVPPAARWPSLIAPCQNSAARSSLASAPA